MVTVAFTTCKLTKIRIAAILYQQRALKHPENKFQLPL